MARIPPILNFFSKKKPEDELKQQLSSNEKIAQLNATVQGDIQEQYALMDKEKGKELTKWQQDLDPKMVRFYLELLGLAEVDGNYYKVNEPMCSQDSAYKIVNLITGSCANQHTMMSKFSEEQVMESQIAIEQKYLLDISIPEMRKGKTNLHNLSVIKQSIRNYTKPALFRALHGGERTHMSTIRTEKTIHNEDLLNAQINKKKSLFSI